VIARKPRPPGSGTWQSAHTIGLVAEHGKPLGNEMGGMREDDIGSVGRLRVAAEIDSLDATLHGIADEGHAELRVPVGKAARVAKPSVRRGLGDRAMAVGA